jgi:hypothetical protein
MKSSRLNPVSKKRRGYQAEYRAQTLLVKERSGGRCEIRQAHDCDGIATDSPHHRKFRSQGGSNSVDNLLDVCWTGHAWIHHGCRDCMEMYGLIVPRETPEFPYQGEAVNRSTNTEATPSSPSACSPSVSSEG